MISKIVLLITIIRLVNLNKYVMGYTQGGFVNQWALWEFSYGVDKDPDYYFRRQYTKAYKVNVQRRYSIFTDRVFPVVYREPDRSAEVPCFTDEHDWAGAGNGRYKRFALVPDFYADPDMWKSIKANKSWERTKDGRLILPASEPAKTVWFACVEDETEEGKKTRNITDLRAFTIVMPWQGTNMAVENHKFGPPDPDTAPNTQNPAMNLQNTVHWSEWSCFSGCSDKSEVSRTRQGTCVIKKMNFRKPLGHELPEKAKLFTQWQQLDFWLGVSPFADTGIPCRVTWWTEFVPDVYKIIQAEFANMLETPKASGRYMDVETKQITDLDACQAELKACEETRKKFLTDEDDFQDIITIPEDENGVVKPGGEGVAELTKADIQIQCYAIKEESGKSKNENTCIAKPDQTVQISCKEAAEQRINPTSLQWKFGNKLIDPFDPEDSGANMYMSGKHNVIIRKMTKEEEGDYTCGRKPSTKSKPYEKLGMVTLEMQRKTVSIGTIIGAIIGIIIGIIVLVWVARTVVDVRKKDKDKKAKVAKLMKNLSKEDKAKAKQSSDDATTMIPQSATSENNTTEAETAGATTSIFKKLDAFKPKKKHQVSGLSSHVGTKTLEALNASNFTEIQKKK